MDTMSKKEAIAKVLSTYNEKTHKLIDVSDNSTLILQLPNGVYVTIASIGVQGKDWACLDISVKGKVNNQRMLGFTGNKSDGMEHKIYSLAINNDLP